MQNGTYKDEVVRALEEVIGRIQTIPTTLVVDSEGRIRAVHKGFADLETFEKEIGSLLPKAEEWKVVLAVEGPDPSGEAVAPNGPWKGSRDSERSRCVSRRRSSRSDTTQVVSIPSGCSRQSVSSGSDEVCSSRSPSS